MSSQSKPLPPIERVRELLDYDPATGVFMWKVKPARNMRAGDKAGTVAPSGYVFLRIDRKRYKAHRVAWLLVTGEDPVGFDVDHRDCNKANNRASNLRLVTEDGGNARNTKRPPNNRSGIKGVYWDKRLQRWRAVIGHKGMKHHVGTFANRTEARRAIAKKRAELHGEWARHS